MPPPAIILGLGLTFALPCHGDTTEQPDVITAAISYLSKLSQGKLDISKHTALSQHCSPQRRKTIQERLDFIQKNNFLQDDQFIFETKKTEGNLAAAIIRTQNPAAPLNIRIHAVALVRNNGIWTAAPLPGSFANTGYGYDEQIERTVINLERWMAREQILRQARHRKQALTKYKSTLADIEQKAHLDSIEPEEAIVRFLEQCRKKNLQAILARMGAASGNLLEPMETAIELISKGLSNNDESSEWHLLTNPTIIPQVLLVDHTRNEVAVGFLNLRENGQDKILYFPIHHAKGKIFVRLASLLKISLLPIQKRWLHRQEQLRGNENILLKHLPITILKNTKAAHYRTAQNLLDQFLSTLKEDNFTQCITMIPRSGKHFGNVDQQTTALRQLGILWQSLRGRETQQPPQIVQQKVIAIAPLHFTLPQRPSEIQTIKIHMLKYKHGWHIIDPARLEESTDNEQKTTLRNLEQRLTIIKKEQQEKKSRTLLENVITLTPTIALEPVNDQEARKLFTSYRTHLRNKNIQAALASSAIIKGTKSPDVLKILKYAIRGATDHIRDDRLVGINRSGKWLGISARTKSKRSDTLDYPLYIITNTGKSPRILIDVDLRYASNSGRVILNNRTWKKLEKNLNKQSLEHITTLFEKHNKLVDADIKATLKLHE